MDDGWEAIWEPKVGKYYFYNKVTKETTWKNPRVPEKVPEGTVESDEIGTDEKEEKGGDYEGNDANGDKDEKTKDSMSTYEKYKYYKELRERQLQEELEQPSASSVTAEVQSKHFQGFETPIPEEEKLNDPYDPSHVVNARLKGRSLKSIRQNVKLSKKQIEQFKKRKQERKIKQVKDFMK
uniref:ARAD1C15136p n=1 Tax=Blastobotrys adeninivorans TaxID=409370 RepID=A0A060T1A6_BLAAD